MKETSKKVLSDQRKLIVKELGDSRRKLDFFDNEIKQLQKDRDGLAEKVKTLETQRNDIDEDIGPDRGPQ